MNKFQTHRVLLKWARQSVVYSAALFAQGLFQSAALAAPISFLLQPSGNQNDVKWHRLETDRFVVYHDEKSLPLAKYALTAAENAYPDLSLLLGVKLEGDNLNQTPFPNNFVTSRFGKIPIVMSTRSDGASFANFANQNIEVQVVRGAGASLYQHELVHRMMYEHFDPYLGVAGRGFTLAMLPTWWIEGLPEYMTESLGRLDSAGAARTMALNNKYLSYDSLHALYKATGDVFFRGYVTSGRMYKYMLDRMQTPDLGVLHGDLFNKVITPPFVIGTDWLLKNRMGKNSRELYSEYQSFEKNYWKTRLAGMPAVVDESNAKSWVTSGGTPPAVVTREGVFVSQLTSGLYSSALLFVDAKTQKARRIPVNVKGSTFFDFHPAELKNGSFWTARAEKFSNATSGHQLVFAKFKGPLAELSDSKISETNVLRIATPEAPVLLSQIYALGDGRAFVLGNLRGENILYAVNGPRKAVTVLKRWNAPTHVSFVRRQRLEKEVSKDNCVVLLIDEDQEKTSLERLCSNNKVEEILPAGKHYLRDGFETTDGTIKAIAGWNDLASLVELKPGGVLTPVGPFPEWVEKMLPWADTRDIAMWVYDGEDFNLHRVNPDLLSENYKTWAKNLAEGSDWKNFPSHKPYLPPYARYAAVKRFELLKAGGTKTVSTPLSKTEVSNTTGRSAASPPPNLDDLPPPAPSQSLEERKISLISEDASLRGGHWFTYPLAVPPMFGGWSLGVVSVPYIDEIERQRVQVSGVYDFNTGQPSATVAYINNRWFDGFSLSLYSSERFNGLYYVGNCPTDPNTSCASTRPLENSYKYFYLRDQGVSVSANLDLLPSTFNFSISGSFSKTQSLYGTLPSAIGPQNANVANLGGVLGFNVFNFAFYDRKTTETGGQYLEWRTNANVSASKTVSVGTTTDGRGRVVDNLNFQQLATSASSTFSYRDHAVTLRSNISSTAGPYSFNLREYYQPYRTYLQGSGGSLNDLTYSLAGNGQLNVLRFGYATYRNSVDYSFPLLSDLDKIIYIAYLQSLRGEVVFARGGVGLDKNLVRTESVTSASAALRLNIDIKGFAVSPSLAYGRLIGKPGWGFFSQLSFSQFF